MRWRTTRLLIALMVIFIIVTIIANTDGKKHHKHKHNKKGRKKSVVSRSFIPSKPTESKKFVKAITGIKKSEETWHQNDKPQELTPETIKIVRKEESIKASELPGAFGDDFQAAPDKSTADVKSQRQGALNKVKILHLKDKKKQEAPTNPTEAITIVEKQNHGGRVPGAKLGNKKKYKKKGHKHIPVVVKQKNQSKIKSEKVEGLTDKTTSSRKHKKRRKHRETQTSLTNDIVQKIVKLASASEIEDESTTKEKSSTPVTHKATPPGAVSSAQAKSLTVANKVSSSAKSKNLKPVKLQKVKKVEEKDDSPVKSLLAELAADEEEDDEESGSAMSEIESGSQPPQDAVTDVSASQGAQAVQGASPAQGAPNVESAPSVQSASSVQSAPSVQGAPAIQDAVEEKLPEPLLQPSATDGKLESNLEPDIECPWACFWRCENYCPKKCCNNPFHCPEECSMFCTSRCPDKCCPPGMKKLPDVNLNFQEKAQGGKEAQQMLLPPQSPQQANQQQQSQQMQPNPQGQYPSQQYMSQQQVAQQASSQTGYPGYCPLFCPNVCVPGSCQPECCSQQPPQVQAQAPQPMYYPPPPQSPYPSPMYSPPPSPPPAPSPSPMYAPQPPSPSYAPSIMNYCPDACSAGCVSQCPNECCPGSVHQFEQ